MCQAKFEAAIRHGVKIVTADWLIDSIETAALMDEGDYSLGGRGCGDHTHKQSEPEVSRCNGAVEERTVVQNARRQRIRKNEMELEGERGNVESVGAPVISGGDGARPENGECGPAVEVEVTGRASGAELRLLSGLVFHLTGYLECMEPDTLFKWKEVSLSLPLFVCVCVCVCVSALLLSSLFSIPLLSLSLSLSVSLTHTLGDSSTWWVSN